MKNSISPRRTPLPSVQEISKNNDKLLRELFKSKINGSFLIKIKSEVLSKLRADTFKETLNKPAKCRNGMKAGQNIRAVGR